MKMAKPFSASDWQFILNEREEEIKALKREINTANFELTNSRKEIGRLKTKCLEFEDAVVDYRADVSRWKTLYELGSPNKPTGIFDQQKQLDDLKRQLNAVSTEKNRLAEQLRRRPQSSEEQVDNPVFRTQLQNVQVETNRLRYTVQQKDDDIRHVLQDLKDQRLANDRLSLQIKSKEDEIDRLRKQLLDTPNVVMAASPPPAPQNTQELQKLRDDNVRLSGNYQRLNHELKDLQERNIHLHQQNMMYEDDYKKEKEDKQMVQRQLATAKEETRNLQAVIDVFNQGVGQGGVNIQPPAI